jgi:hypothetical protein
MPAKCMRYLTPAGLGLAFLLSSGPGFPLRTMTRMLDDDAREMCPDCFSEFSVSILIS